MEGCHHPPNNVDVSAKDVEINFHWKEHAERLVCGLMDMFFDGCHVDMDVKFGGEFKWRVHRVLLSVFLPCVRESIAETDLKLSDVAEEIDDVRALLEFVYSGHLKLRKERVEPLRRLADRLNFRDLSSALVKLSERDSIPLVSLNDRTSSDDGVYQPSTARSPSIIDVDDSDDGIASDIPCDQPEMISIVTEEEPPTVVEVQAQDVLIKLHAESEVQAINQEPHDKVQVHVNNRELDVEVCMKESVARVTSVCPDERTESEPSIFQEVEQSIEPIVDDLIAADRPESSCSSETWETSDCGSDDDDVSYLAKKAPFKCLLCPWIFSSKEVARSHFKKVHHEVKLFECQHCDFDVVSENTLKSHIELFHKPRGQTPESTERVPSKCHLCSRTFAEKTYLNNHIWLRHMAPSAALPSGAMRCILCSKFVCADRYDLQQHFFANHVDGTMLKCGSCEFFAATENQLKLHVKRFKHYSPTIGTWPNTTVRKAKIKAVAAVKAALQETSENEDEEQEKRPQTATAESVEESASVQGSVQKSPGDSTAKDEVYQPYRSVNSTERLVEEEVSVKALGEELPEESKNNNKSDNKPKRCPLCNFKCQMTTPNNCANVLDEVKCHVKLVHPECLMFECKLCEFWTIDARFMAYHHDENHAPSTAGVTARKTMPKYNSWATRKTCHAISFSSARRQMREVPVEDSDDENAVICHKCNIRFSCHMKLVTHNRIIHHVNTKSLKRKSRARLPPAKLVQG